MAKKSKTKKSTAIGAVIGILLMVFVFNVMPYMKGGKDVVDKELVEVANEINNSCPMMVDSQTQLVNAVALPDNVLQYNYKLVNTGLSQLNPDEMRSNLESGIINNVRTNPDLKFFRDNKTTLAYHYIDQNGEFVLKLSVTPEMYLN